MASIRIKDFVEAPKKAMRNPYTGKYAKYSTKGYITAMDLQKRSFMQRIPLGKGIRGHYKCGLYEEVINKIFIDFLQMVVEDIIENGVIFKTPTQKEMMIYVSATSKKGSGIKSPLKKNSRNNKKYHQMFLNVKDGRKTIIKRVQIPKPHFYAILKNVELSEKSPYLLHPIIK